MLAPPTPSSRTSTSSRPFVRATDTVAAVARAYFATLRERKSELVRDCAALNVCCSAREPSRRKAPPHQGRFC
jgi:hypothetical protein